jgi:hypothetical protein
LDLGVTLLESRRPMAAVVTCLGQDGQDLVGPDASQGPDGIQDLHLHLSGLAAAVDRIAIQAPGGFEWATEPNPSGAALAECFPSPSPGQGDLYINPQVRSAVSSTGGALPLGGATGSLIPLANGVPLAVTISYQGQADADATTVDVAGLVSATDPMPSVATPGDVVDSFQVTSAGQDGTGEPYEQGFVHLVVTAPSGVTFHSDTFSQITWGLSDAVGLAWDSTSGTLAHNHIYATFRPGSPAVADLYFPPARDESPGAGSSAPTMLLRVALPDDDQVYVTPFPGAAWDVSRLITPINAQAPPPAPATEAQLRALLLSQTPEYDTIELPASQTIVITQPMVLTHSVRIVGQGATLLFQQGATADWPASASGAISVDTPDYTNIHVELDDFTIEFDPGAPIRWSNPTGNQPVLWDPENNPGGIVHAVIDTRDSNTNLNRDILTLNGMTISGPPAFDGSSFTSLQAQLRQSGDATHQYAGEAALDLIRTNDEDSGSIAGSTFQGGPIELFGGPWSITGNTVLGSTAETYSPGAFGLHSPHDVRIQGNWVSQSDPAGREFRLVILAQSGAQNVVEGNWFGGGAGQAGDEVSYDVSSGQFGGINDPEVILAESDSGVLFAGRPAAASADGRLLVLEGLRASAYPSVTGSGMVVSILSGVNHDGTPNLTMAGQWYRVAQQVSLAGNTLELLMQDPLPSPPPGGSLVVEVTGGFVNNSFQGNTLDLTSRSSTGIKLDGADYGTRIVANQIIGGTTYGNVYNGTAIQLGAALASAASGDGAFPMPSGWTALPDLGAIIAGNTVQDSLGGIILGVEHGANYWESRVTSASETGRVLLTAAVTGNTFAWDAGFLESWASAYSALGNDPDEDSTPPTVTVGSGWSARAPGPYGSPRFPWTVGGALRANGSDQPIFVDPTENAVTLGENSVQTLAPDGTIIPGPGPSGQVYAGTINGVAIAPTWVPESFHGQPYYPFNLHNLDIAAALPPAPTPTPTPSPAPTPPPTPTPTPPAPPPPVVPAAPANVAAVAAGPHQVNLSWSPATGATQYVVERSRDRIIWTGIVTGITTTFFSDAGLDPATTYQYRVLAVSGAGVSPAGAVVSVETDAQSDVLSAQPMVITATRRIPFAGIVVTFTDANALAPAGSFAAIIRWGDGSVTQGTIRGGHGSFLVLGRHVYSRAGRYLVTVHVTVSAPAEASTSTIATANVGSHLRTLNRKGPGVRRTRARSGRHA